MRKASLVTAVGVKIELLAIMHYPCTCLFLHVCHSSVDRFSPFIFIGIGGYYLIGSAGFENPITIPFGLGIKYNIFERLTLGLQWSYQKTFSDQIDGVINIQDANNTPVIHNDDWYSFCGVFLTYKLFKDKIDCPIYK